MGKNHAQAALAQLLLHDNRSTIVVCAPRGVAEDYDADERRGGVQRATSPFGEPPLKLACVEQVR